MTTTVSNYAKVLYQLNVSADSISIAEDTFAESKELMKVLCSPVIMPTKKYEIIDKIFPKDICNFIKVVSKNGRMTSINDIFKEYHNWYNKENKIVVAHLYYVVKPTEKQQEKLKAFVKKKLNGSKVELELIEKPDLIGGFVIEANGHEFDRSFKNKLNALNRKLVWR